jgi:hypothetical protein
MALCLQVWSGLMGRLPKRTMLSTMPPAPHLTGNLFMIDLAAVDRGWAMLPAGSIGAPHADAPPTEPRKWAAISELEPGTHSGSAFDVCRHSLCQHV